MRDPHTLSPTSLLVAWPNGDQDYSAHARLAGKLGLETNRAPLPPAAVGRARIAQPGPVSSVPRRILKYALQARPRQAFPAVSILHLSPLLCRAALYLYVLTSVIPSAFCQRYPRYSGTLTLLLFRLRNQNLVSCMYALGRSEVTHAAQV
jgi:hypothetical protein